MEELRSTEILDKEIQADARKKAEKIIKAAESEVKAIEQEVPARLEKAQNEKIEKIAQKLQVIEKDLNSSLPLEKERFLVSYIQSSIDEGMNEYFSSLKDDEIISLFAGEFSSYEDKIEGRAVKLYVYGLDPASCKKVFDKKVKVLSAEKTEFNKQLPEKSAGLTTQKGIILETEDRQIRIRLTLSEIVSQIEEKYRKELYEKLFEGRL